MRRPVSALVFLFFAGCLFAQGQNGPPRLPPGVWIATLSEAIFPGRVYLTVELQGSLVSGAFRTAAGHFGRVRGRLRKNDLLLQLDQSADACPASYTMFLTLDVGRATGRFRGGSCTTEEEEAGTAALVRAEEADVSVLRNISHDAAATDRARRNELCPRCPRVLLFYVDALTGGYQTWRLSASQRAWMERELRHQWIKERRPRFWVTSFQENADYVLFWTQTRGYRPAIEYDIGVEPEQPTVGAALLALPLGEGWGRLKGSVRVRPVRPQPGGQRSDDTQIALAVYDAQTGASVRETWHTGSDMWMRPDREAFADAIRFLLDRQPKESPAKPE